jgi:CCR4-NOT transcription complex subunit 4
MYLSLFLLRRSSTICQKPAVTTTTTTTTTTRRIQTCFLKTALTGGIDISDISSLGGAAHLSSDLFDEPGRSVTPGLEGLGQSLSLDFDDEEHVPRRSTPSIPPGFTLPAHATLRDEALDSLPTSRSSSRASLRRGNSQMLPALPMLHGTPLRVSTPLRHETRPSADVLDDLSTPTKRGRSETHLANVEYAESNDATPGAEVDTQSRAEIKAEKAEADKAAKKEAERTEKAEKAAAVAFAAAETAAMKRAGEQVQVAASPLRIIDNQSSQDKNKTLNNTVDLAKDLTPAEAAAAARLAAGESISKKKHPGKIDITAAVLKGIDVPTSTTSTPLKNENVPRTWNAITSSRPQSPSVASDTPRKVTAPRTLRLTTALPPPAPIVSPAVRSIPVAASSMPSRQPSLASIHYPGTPNSEHISDDVSMTSTSISRAGTPPPPSSSRVGSAPVRHNTKSQQRKIRQDKAKQMIEAEIMAKDVDAPSLEPMQEAITSRKKKSKRDKVSTPTTSTPAASTPVPSRPASPKTLAMPEEPTKVEKPATPVKVDTPPPPPPSPPASVAPIQTPPPPPAPLAAPPAVAAKLTPASVIAEMRNISGSNEELFGTLFSYPAQVQAYYTPSQPISPSDVAHGRLIPARIPDLTQEDIKLLRAGQVWRARPFTDDQHRLWDREMVSPSGTIIRHMEPAHEDRFLALEMSDSKIPENLRFHPIQHSNTPTNLGFPKVDLAAIARDTEGASDGTRHRSANAMEKAVEEGSKKGSFLVDTAGKYVNEYIIPPVLVSPPTEKVIKEEQQRDKDQHLNADELEHKLNDARRIADEKESSLRRMVKKNRKVAGMAP